MFPTDVLGAIILEYSNILYIHSRSMHRPRNAAEVVEGLGDGSDRRANRLQNRTLSRMITDIMNYTRGEYDETAMLERDQQNNLRAWLDRDTGYKFFGPKAGWPVYCNNPVNTWEYYHQHPRADEAKTVYDEWVRIHRDKNAKYSKPEDDGSCRSRSRSRSRSRGGAGKRSKCNKRKSSSRVLSKSRRRK